MNISLSSLIWLIVAVVAILLIYETTRKSKQKTDSTPKPLEPIADQMEPTLTGKFRVKQMLDITQQTDPSRTSRPSAKTGVVAHDEDAEALPDPFKPKK